ncbi:hypothetical protein ARMGADRAFT_402462 [Armillaria gallica]|uniref:DNA helicase Pif1-like 2B domain-containing protein n=1 Tax=Armillaria gallica TaxID=47427 RepID=A0A2H3E3M8_ARMGA|nr:hypothetical protein ARMGADRAFT_402462 [Armillaria gallica]
MDRLLERLVAPKLIQLKVGAQVMLIKNLEQGHLVNGSVGSVVDFETQHEALTSEDTEIGEVERKDETDEERAARLEKLPAQQVWPVVRFANGRRILCIPQEFTVENSNGDVEAKRDQLGPLACTSRRVRPLNVSELISSAFLRRVKHT